ARTDDFQNLVAPSMAVYPVVSDLDADDTFGDNDPAPGSFKPADLDYRTIGTHEGPEAWAERLSSFFEQRARRRRVRR
ncbi:MAG TPA: hypothetical protein ACFYED_06080, partial [Candidatus Tripitaka californicus]|uniref:hypothetical protein n=1 Tax=Candidatus Tripitaka californicus TaxID=3367616 RepID=UPI00402801FD